VSNVCILRLSAIGDVCNALASVQAIQRARPNTKITWIIGKVEYELLKHHTGIEFVVFDKKKGIKAYWNLYRSLIGKRFDYLLLMQVAFRASLASLCVRASVRIGFDENRSKELHSLFVNQTIAPKSREHVADAFMQFAHELGVRQDSPDWKIYHTEHDQAWATQEVMGSDKNFMICPAASKDERNWTIQGYAAVAKFMSQNGYRVFICGGASRLEYEMALQIAHESKIPVRNLVGQTTLTQLWALIGRMQLLIAPDTGPVHMANAVGTKVVGLYAHSNPRRTGPYNFQNLIVENYFETYERLVLSSKNAPRWGLRFTGHSLMQAIEIKTVINRLKSII
jgi:heptosyltransferase I